jgi:hypothetical protein
MSYPHSDHEEPASATQISEQPPTVDQRESAESPVFLRLVNRYISVWVWSILFGVAVSVSFSITNVRNAGRYGDLTLIIMALYLLAALFTFRAWSVLLRYLNQFIIPLIFTSSEVAETHVSVFKNLTRALGSLIFAFAFLILASLIQAALEFSAGGGGILR